jgi:HSP20 family protein
MEAFERCFIRRFDSAAVISYSQLGPAPGCHRVLEKREDGSRKIQLKLPSARPQSFNIKRIANAALRWQIVKQSTSMKGITQMQTLTRWEPFREMEDFQNRLSTLFGRMPLRRPDGHGREEITLADWTPLADITEDEKEYLIKAELPEMKKEDVKVTVENGVLTISGERKFEKEEKKKKYHRVERGYGTFVRSFTLPDDADANKVKAEFKNGLLTVHLPKSEHAKPKHIEVNVA